MTDNTKIKGFRSITIIIEFSPVQQRLLIRGCWPSRPDLKIALLHPRNIQVSIPVLEGLDMGSKIGFDDITLTDNTL